MVIAIEAQRIFRSNKHGMDFVVLEQIRRLQKIDKENTYYVITAHGDDRCLDESENVHIVELDCPTYPLWEQWALPRYVNQLKPDLLHCTSNTAPVWCDVPLVLTLHDIIFLEDTHKPNASMYQRMGRVYRRLVVPRILPKCRKIITVSEFERQRIGDALGLLSDNLVTIYNACADHFSPTECRDEVRRRYDLPERYMLFLGNTDPKKNTDNLLRAYGIANFHAPDLPDLVVADLTHDMKDQFLDRLGLQCIADKIHFLGYVPNGMLPDIYSGAEIFLYPSLRESFGIPQLEAMSCGTPVLAANTSAMPEVVGDAALLVDPFSADDIAQGILRIYNDVGLRELLIDRGFERVKLYSWDNNARQLIKLYEDVAGLKG